MPHLQTLSPSALQRSKSAPNPLVDEPAKNPPARARGGGRFGPFGAGMSPSTTTTPGPALAVDGLQVHIQTGTGTGMRTRTRIRPRTRPWRSPLTSPRHDAREDPFSLAGFFPSRPGSPAWRHAGVLDVDEDEDEEMSELEVEVEEEDEEEEEEGRVGALPPLRSLSMNALDEYAREVIAKESRFGILGLVRVPSFFKSIGESYFDEAEEDALEASRPATFGASPAGLTIDEPFDAETLRESMLLRRVASERELAHAAPLAERAPSMGRLGLFAPTADAREAEDGWANTLYRRFLGAE